MDGYLQSAFLVLLTNQSTLSLMAIKEERGNGHAEESTLHLDIKATEVTFYV